MYEGLSRRELITLHQSLIRAWARGLRLSERSVELDLPDWARIQVREMTDEFSALAMRVETLTRR